VPSKSCHHKHRSLIQGLYCITSVPKLAHEFVLILKVRFFPPRLQLAASQWRMKAGRLKHHFPAHHYFCGITRTCHHVRLRLFFGPRQSVINMSDAFPGQLILRMHGNCSPLFATQPSQAHRTSAKHEIYDFDRGNPAVERQAPVKL